MSMLCYSTITNDKMPNATVGAAFCSKLQGRSPPTVASVGGSRTGSSSNSTPIQPLAAPLPLLTRQLRSSGHLPRRLPTSAPLRRDSADRRPRRTRRSGLVGARQAAARRPARSSGPARVRGFSSSPSRCESSSWSARTSARCLAVPVVVRVDIPRKGAGPIRPRRP